MKKVIDSPFIKTTPSRGMLCNPTAQQLQNLLFFKNLNKNV